MWLLLAFAARAGSADDLAVAANPDLPLTDRQAAYERLARAEETSALRRLAEDEQTPFPQRWVAIRAFGSMRDDASRLAILHFLESKSPHARMAALGAIGDRGDRTLSSKAVARLADPALLVRAAAVDALARLADPSTLSDLERALRDPGNHYRGVSLFFRRHLVEAMAGLGKPAAPALARTLDDTDPDVAATALAALERIAGFSYNEGRTPEQVTAAWKRWAGR